VLHSVGEVYTKYDKAVFISGDGDFLSLYLYLDKRDKLEAVLIPNRFAYSKLLNNVRTKLRFLTDVKPLFRDVTNKKPQQTKRPGAVVGSEALDLPGHGDYNSNTSKHRGKSQRS
jgi:uncharacterized LabA/DUF88 family protein